MSTEQMSNTEEIWDEFSEYMDDNLSSLERFAGSSIITKGNFIRAADKLTGISTDNWISIENKIPKEGDSVAFIIDSKDDFYNGKVLGGTYQGHRNGLRHEFTTPGMSWKADLWQPLPLPPNN